jgi:Glycosyl transferase family 11
MKNDVISPKLSGRLGNHMFMIANALSIANDKNIKLKLNKRYFVGKESYLTSIFSNIEILNESYDNVIMEPSGYFQSPKYFIKYNDQVLNLFRPNPSFDEVYKQYDKDLNDYCAIHIRRGDYLNKSDYHPVMSEKLIRHFINTHASKKIIFFSDDINWVKRVFKNDDVEFHENRINPVYDLWYMSKCDEFLISNSTYSWWAAYLSNSNKIYYPSIWYGPSAKKELPNDLCPKNWNKINCIYDNGLITL